MFIVVFPGLHQSQNANGAPMLTGGGQPGSPASTSQIQILQAPAMDRRGCNDSPDIPPWHLYLGLNSTAHDLTGTRTGIRRRKESGEGGRRNEEDGSEAAMRRPACDEGMLRAHLLTFCSWNRLDTFVIPPNEVCALLQICSAGHVKQTRC